MRIISDMLGASKVQIRCCVRNVFGREGTGGAGSSARPRSKVDRERKRAPVRASKTKEIKSVMPKRLAVALRFVEGQSGSARVVSFECSALDKCVLGVSAAADPAGDDRELDRRSPPEAARSEGGTWPASLSTARPDVIAGATRVDDRLEASDAALARARESLSAMRSCGSS